MPSSNDSTNPNSPFGVQYGYPAGTRISKNQPVVAEIQQQQVGLTQPLAELFSTSRETQFSAIGLPRVYPTQSQMKSGDLTQIMSEDPIALGTARYMANPQVANRYFEQRNARDQKALATAYRAFEDPQRALESVFPEEGLKASSFAEAQRVVSERNLSETKSLSEFAGNVVQRADVQPEETTSLTKAHHMAGRLVAHQIERNVQQPMDIGKAYGLAQQKLGHEAGDIISAVGGKRLDAYSEKEKSAFKEATKEIKGSEPKVNQQFSDLTTVVKELSNALKDLTKSTKGQTQQESRSDLIQKRHDLAVERDQERHAQRQEIEMFKAGASQESVQQRHDLSMIRQDRRQSTSALIQDHAIQKRHENNVELAGIKHQQRMELEDRRESFKREMAGDRPTKNQFLLGMMHRGDVLDKKNLMGRATRRFAQGGFNMLMGVAGGSSISQSLGAINPFGVPIGALTAQPFSMLSDVASKASEIELVSMQAEFLNTGAIRQGAMIKGSSGGYTVDTIFELSTQLGISPAQSASMLKNVGLADPSNNFSVSDLTGLVAQGFSPEAISQIGGQLSMLNIGLGSKDVVGLLNRSGQRGALGMNFAQRIADFTRSRKIAGLRTPKNFLGATASRIDRMGVGVEEGINTLSRMQGMVVQAGQGLTQMFGGMADLAIQSYAFEKAGGDLFEAQAETETISGSPEMMQQVLQSRGMSRQQARLAIAGKGFTTSQVLQLERATGGDKELDTNVDKIDTSGALAVSRKLAKKQQEDIKMTYSMADDGESMIDKLDAMLKADTKYQQSVLKKMVTSDQISAIGDAVTGLTTLLANTNVLIGEFAELIKKARGYMQ